MASTYSNLKIQLMGTGENSGSWGTITNVNLGTALEEAIVGSADVAFSSANVTLTLSDTNSSQTARNLRLNLTGTTGGARDLIVPGIEKVYIVNNGCADAITVKNSSGSGIAVPAGKTMWVYNTGSNVVDAVTHLSSLTLGTALPIASGGTGSNSATFCNLQTNVAGILPVVNGGTGVNSSTGTGAVVLNSAPSITNATLVTPILGTPQSGTLTNCTGLPIATGVANLGTGVATFLTTPSSTNLAAAVTGETGSGALVFATSPTLVTPALGTPSSGTLTSCTGLPIDGGTTGTLPVARGGTGVTTSTGTGSTVLSASPALTGTPTAPTATLGTNTTQIATTAFALANGIPSGAIVLWSGSVASIPSGWLLCNGSSGTPDLRNRFVVGAGSTYAVGATGGSADAIVVSHTHTATSTVTDPGHFHTTSIQQAANGNPGGFVIGSSTSGVASSYNSDTKTTGISVSTSVASAGSSGTNANLPPYYALCYIMKA